MAKILDKIGGIAHYTWDNNVTGVRHHAYQVVGIDYNSNVWVYDSRTEKWTKLPPLPRKEALHEVQASSEPAQGQAPA